MGACQNTSKGLELRDVEVREPTDCLAKAAAAVCWLASFVGGGGRGVRTESD